MKKLLIMVLLLTGCGHHYRMESAGGRFHYRQLERLDLTHLMIDQMSLEEKIYQQLIVGFDGTTITPDIQQAAAHHLGGVLLFQRNITNGVQVKQLNQQLSSADQHIPLFISIDQEGGRVNRLPKEYGNIEPAYRLSQSNNHHLVYERGKWTGEMLKSLHFNLDFAPVLDVWTNPANTVIGDRSYGTSPEQVTEMAGAFNQGLHQSGIATSGKHFPGHGDTFLDSHQALPVITKSLHSLKQLELRPFDALKNELDMMMVSHIVIQSLDSEPSSLSRTVVTDLLKNDMHYKGVIITDDLAMGAISDRYTTSDAAIRALSAGNTMVLIGSNTGDLPQLVADIKTAVERGDIKKEDIDSNVEKILRLKSKYGIL